MSKKIKCNVCENINHLNDNEYEYIDYKGKKDINIKVPCKFCSSIRFNSPTNESLLFTLQKKYLKNQDSETLGKMCQIIEGIAHNIIVKKVPYHLKFNQDVIEDKVSFVIEKFVKYYTKKPNFLIESSFTPYIEQVCKYPLYNKKDKEKEKNEISMEYIVDKINNSESDNNMTMDNFNIDFHLAGSNSTYTENDDTEDIDYTDEEIDYEKEWEEKSESYSFNNVHKNHTDDYIIDNANIDFFINDIMKAIEGILNATAKKCSVREALIQSIFFYHYLGKKDQSFFNKLADIFGDGSSNKFRTILDYFEPSFKLFEKKLLILRNSLYEDYLK